MNPNLKAQFIQNTGLFGQPFSFGNSPFGNNDYHMGLFGEKKASNILLT
jgi:hypothetical protein